MKKHNILLLALSFLFGSFVYINSAIADEAEQAISYRQNVMKLLATNSKMIKATLTKKINHQQHLPILATHLVDAAAMLKGNFPDGSDFGETDAKEEIWENKADFDAKIEDLEHVTKELLSALKQKQSNIILMDKYKSLTQSCKSCHKKYREK
ncbi:MAG: cytochrome c [Pseudomonadota bacterium]